MPRNKRDLEKIESLAERSEKFQGPPMEEVSAYLRSLIESALADRKLENSALEQQSDPQPDKPKSEGQIEFENMISAISNRMHYHAKSLTVSNEPSELNKPVTASYCRYTNELNFCVND